MPLSTAYSRPDTARFHLFLGHDECVRESPNADLYCCPLNPPCVARARPHRTNLERVTSILERAFPHSPNYNLAFILESMSITRLVTTRTPVRERLAADFPKPKLRLRAKLLVPSSGFTPGLVGTAYDYLLRFHLLRAMPFATSEQWVAEKALERIGALATHREILVGEKWLFAQHMKFRMERVLSHSRRSLRTFLSGTRLSTCMIESAIRLAHCDLYFRIQRFDKRFGKPLKRQVKELRSLINATNLEQFTSATRCLLNPSFGEGSIIIGGADADLLIDDMLIDVKTSATLRVRVEDWRQLICYAALNKHFPIGGEKRPKAIRHIGIYFARYNYLVSWPLRKVVDSTNFSSFSGWLRDYAVNSYTNKLDRRAALIRSRADRQARHLEDQADLLRSGISGLLREESNA